MVRAPFYDKNGIKKGAWSAQEDETLIAHIQRYGHPNWRQLPKLAGLARCGKSCRLRWVNYLRPNLKHGNYTPEEDELIIKLHQQLGNKWSAMAEKLPGRTDNEIKNHWHSHLEKRLERKETTSQFKTKPSASDQGVQHAESDSRSFVFGGHSHNILESSVSKSTETDNTEDTIISNDAESTLNGRTREEDSVTIWEALTDFTSDFWTEPFIVENTYTQNDYRGNITPYDGNEWLYQVMRELPENLKRDT